MSTKKRLSKLYAKSKVIPFNEQSKIVFMSDLHRGDYTWADDFNHNELIYTHALKQYLIEDYTYIELGDTDELWDNKKFKNIFNAYVPIFKLLKKFYDKNRYHAIWGNHDNTKKYKGFRKKNLTKNYDMVKRKWIDLFKDIDIPEGLILENEKKQRFFLAHGHQGEWGNDYLWFISRFIVRYIWRFFQKFGFRDPVMSPFRMKRKEKIEQKMIDWVKNNQIPLIAGHTHRVFCADPAKDEAPYFNSGTAVHPRKVTGIEIVNGKISSIQWLKKTDESGKVFIDKEIISGPFLINDYYK